MKDELEGKRADNFEAAQKSAERILLQTQEQKKEPPSFGEQIQWTLVQDPKSYYPTRLEYFAGKALQGLVTGRSEKDHRKAVVKALELAVQLEELCDKAQGG